MKTETLEINGFKIVLPIGLERKVETKVRDAYHDFLKNSTRDVVRHLTCLTTLIPPELPIRQPDPILVFHMFGGLGASAQVIDQTVGHALHTFWERDSVCIDYLRETYPQSTVSFVQDSYQMLPQMETLTLANFDVLLLDASVMTIKTKGVKEMWQKVAAAVTENPNMLIWFTDTACHKIHLNYKSYLADFDQDYMEPTAEGYMNAYSAWLERTHGLVVTAVMREAGECYCVAKVGSYDNKRFQSIPYV